MSTESKIAKPDAENSEPPVFVYDRKTIIELGELLAEMALNVAKKQYKAAKRRVA